MNYFLQTLTQFTFKLSNHMYPTCWFVRSSLC